MNRRALLVTGVGIAALWPLGGLSQQGTKRVGVLLPFVETDAAARTQLDAFRDELQRLGWRNGRNLRLDVRWAGPDPERIRANAADLARAAPDLILSRTTPVTRTLLAQTRSVPIVFVVVSDPLGDGFVSSLARPGANVTGFTNVESTLGGKWVELVRQVKPDVERVGVLYGPKTAPGGGTYYIRMVQSSGAAAGIEIVALPIEDETGVAESIARLGRERQAGLIVTPDVTTANHRRQIISLAAKHRLPAIYSASYFAEDGGLIAYGIDYVDQYRRAAEYADRILRGTRAGDLPVQGPVKFDLAINLKTAAASGMKIPEALLVRADRVIGR